MWSEDVRACVSVHEWVSVTDSVTDFETVFCILVFVRTQRIEIFFSVSTGPCTYLLGCFLSEVLFFSFEFIRTAHWGFTINTPDFCVL